MTKRTFLGIPLDPRLSAKVEELRQSQDGVRWIDAANLHLTLEFLGDTTEEQLKSVENELAGVDGQQFDFVATGISCLPKLRRARVLAVDVQPAFELTELYGAVRSAVGAAGLALKPARFRPHITIARLRRVDLNWLEQMTALDLRLENERFPADRFCLYESILSPKGARYHVLRSYPLE